MNDVHVVVPEGIDDPSRPSGGNTYDRRVCHGLAGIGWVPRLHRVPGRWPRPDAAAHAALAGVVREIPNGAVVLLDGLVASTAPAVLVPQARRLRLVVLVHMPLGRSSADDRVRESAVLTAAAAVVTTSGWTRQTLMQLYPLAADRVHVATPGVDSADLAAGSETAGALLCVAAVVPGKGQDVLLDALESMTSLSWQCRMVGSVERDPAFAQALGRRIARGYLSDRVSLTGALDDADLDRSYAAADLFVLASRSETYGMVVTEALARGVPVVASEVGGVPEALGRSREGTVPGLLVPPDDPAALGAALRSWLGDAELRRRLRRAARERRTALAGWPATTAAVARVLSGAVAQ